MDEWGILFSPFGIAVIAVIGGIASAMFASAQRTRIRELEIRERIAMIERGMVPPPETDPGGFERRMRAIDHVQDHHVGARFRAGGIMVGSVGLGLMTFLWFVGAPRVGVGLGGFLVFIGLGLLLNSALAAPRRVDPPTPPAGVSGPANPD